MKVLMISLDASLLEENPAGDVLERMKEYAERVDALEVLVFSPHAKTKQINERLCIIGTGGAGKLARFVSGWRKAIALGEGKDVITTQDPFFSGLVGYCAARKQGIPLVVDVHGDFFESVGFLKRTLAKFLLKKARIVRTVNPKIKDDFAAMGIANTRVAPVGVRTEWFSNAKEAAVVSGSPVVLYVGRLEKEKGVRYLVEAFALFAEAHPDAVLLIVGSGSERSALERLARQQGLGNSVQFIGHIEGRALGAYYKACDMMVLPSLRESFGRVILEAAAAGKPVIATDTAGASWLIRNNETGYIVPRGDAEALAHKMRFVWEHQKEAIAVAEKFKEEIIFRFDYTKSIQNVTAIWKEAAGDML